MNRRILSLLLLPCVVLAQSGAALSHSHGIHDPAGHGLRPHFHTHVRLWCDDEDHYHDHGDHSIPHQHEAGDSSALGQSQRPDHFPRLEPDHDSDAVYVGNPDVFVLSRIAPPKTWLISHALVHWGVPMPEIALANPSQATARSAHPPPVRGYGCPLYLWQLSLLI